MINNTFWYKRQPVPYKIKQKLRYETNREQVMELNSDGINSSWLLNVDHEVFKKIFSINRNYLFKGNFTAPPDENDYINSDCYLSDDGLAGFAITHDNWLISMFSNQNHGEFIENVKPLIIKKAEKLVCITNDKYSENKLINLYHHTLSFNAYARTKNDAEKMRECYGDDFIKEFICHYGYPFHLFMIKTNETEPIESPYIFDDYFKAKDFINTKHT